MLGTGRMIRRGLIKPPPPSNKGGPEFAVIRLEGHSRTGPLNSPRRDGPGTGYHRSLAMVMVRQPPRPSQVLWEQAMPRRPRGARHIQARDMGRPGPSRTRRNHGTQPGGGMSSGARRQPRSLQKHPGAGIGPINTPSVDLSARSNIRTRARGDWLKSRGINVEAWGRTAPCVFPGNS